MSKAKAQGTAWESLLVKLATQAGLQARRLSEGGSLDEGDVEVIGIERWILEAKATQSLALHEVLAKAIRKARGVRTAVAWKRYFKVEGSTRRQTRVLVALSLDDFLYLVANQKSQNSVVIEDIQDVA